MANASLELVLTNLGEKMSDEEVDELLKIADTSNGEVNYTGVNLQPIKRERYANTYESSYGLSLRIDIELLAPFAYSWCGFCNWRHNGESKGRSAVDIFRAGGYHMLTGLVP